MVKDLRQLQYTASYGGNLTGPKEEGFERLLEGTLGRS